MVQIQRDKSVVIEQQKAPLPRLAISLFFVIMLGKFRMEDLALDEEKRNRRQQAEDTKRHIFNVALKMLDERGFEAIKVRDIAEAAGVSVGTFYNYYTTKLNVFYETYRLSDEYFQTVVAPRLTQPTARERILSFFDEYARYSSEITDLSLTKVLYNADNHCFDRDDPNAMRHLLEAQVQLGLDNGELHTQLSADEVSHFLMIAARGLVYNWCTHDGSFPLRPAMEGYITQLLRGF
jgi:AcrR family transcriptional regulator